MVMNGQDADLPPGKKLTPHRRDRFRIALQFDGNIPQTSRFRSRHHADQRNALHAQCFKLV